MDDGAAQETADKVARSLVDATKKLYAAGSQQDACRIVTGLAGYLAVELAKELARQGAYTTINSDWIHLLQAAMPWTGGN